MYKYVSRTIVRLLEILQSQLCFVRLSDCPTPFLRLKDACDILLPAFRSMADEDDISFTADPE